MLREFNIQEMMTGSKEPVVVTIFRNSLMPYALEGFGGLSYSQQKQLDQEGQPNFTTRWHVLLERMRKAHPDCVFEAGQPLTKSKAAVYIEVEMTRFTENANSHGFTVGQTEGSKLALEKIRAQLRTDITTRLGIKESPTSDKQ